MKLCTKCGVDRPLKDFHRNRTTKDGLQRLCKTCHRAANRACAEKKPDHYRQAATAWSRKHYKPRGHDPHKSIHNIVRSALRSGRMVRPAACEFCGAGGKIDGHHEDYDKPLDVLWLCSRCHQRLHAGLLTLARAVPSPSGKERSE